MQPTSDQQRYILTEETNQLLFDDIWLDVVELSTPVENPTALFLGGQSGSGKTGLAQFHSNQFADRGGVVLINSDALREYHPTFADLQRTDAERASVLVNPDTVIWQRKLIDVAVKTKRNLLLDGTLGGDSVPILQTMQRLHGEGYSIQISILAVPAWQSRLGIYKRYEDQVTLKGSGRWVGMENHDRLFREIPNTLRLLESEPIIDQIQLYARPKDAEPPALLYDNERVNGQWKQAPMATVMLYSYRNHWPTDAQRIAHERTVLGVFHQLSIRGVNQEAIDKFQKAVEVPKTLLRVVTADDVKRYFDWANDPDTRQQSFNSAPIAWESHEAWFARKLGDPNALLLVYELENSEPFGQVRFEKQPDGEVIIGVSIDKLSRGRGLASRLIANGCEVCRTVWGNVPVSAYIKPDNQPSIRAFERAGFVYSHESRKFGVESVCLTVAG